MDRSRAIQLLAALAALPTAAMAAMVLWLVGRPLATPDLFFHLGAGRAYLAEGLWPPQDPMLFTAHAGGPVQHEWLFGVFAYLVQSAAGDQGLRLVHVAMAAAILVLAARLLRAASGSWLWVAPGLAIFIVLCWQRLGQFRPDLWSIPATLTLHALLLAHPRVPSRGRIAACLAVTLLWANAHSLVGVGVAIVAAGAFGAGLHTAILVHTIKAPPDQVRSAKQRAVTLAVVVGAMLLTTLINPRGVHQILTFFESSGGTAVWEIYDEWHPFHPLLFGPPHNAPSLPWLTWLTADLVMLAFVVAAAAALRPLRARPTREHLEALDPTLFIAAAAAVGAMLISVRFLWLGFLPLCYCLRVMAPLARSHRTASALVGVLAAVTLALSFPSKGAFAGAAADTPRDVSTYLGRPVNRQRFAVEGVDFLHQSGVEGRIFNPYELGAYIGYRLAPRVRTFIDARTEHYPYEVFDEWRAITTRTPDASGRRYLEILDDRSVDFFYGWAGGKVTGYSVPYTLDHVATASGWMPVFRVVSHSVYMRRAPRNAGNALRIKAYYGRLGIPFDLERGLDVGLVLEANPTWAIEQGMVPRDFLRVREVARTGPPDEQARAAVYLAERRFLAGDYERSAQLAQRVMLLPKHRQYGATLATRGLLRAGKWQAARELITQVLGSYGGEPWAAEYRERFAQLARP